MLNSAKSIELGARTVGENHPCYVIAEIGVNHNGSPELAHRMIDAAKSAGADAVKFQTYRTDALVRVGADKAAYQKAQTGEGSQADMLRELELSFDTFGKLSDHCESVGIDFMSTAFDAESLDFVATLNPVCLKWPSGEITNLPLLRRAARSGLPVLLSTGMGGLSEIAAAVSCLSGETSPGFAILQCVSGYPARIEDQNLRCLPALSAAFGCPVGFSDHTTGPFAAVAARGLGMSVLEKHFTLDRSQKGPDHQASSEPGDFAALVDVLRQVEQGLGDGIKREIASVAEVRAIAQKSLVYRTDLPAGHRLTDEDFSSLRPGDGLSPAHVDLVAGRSLRRSVCALDPVDIAHVE